LFPWFLINIFLNNGKTTLSSKIERLLSRWAKSVFMSQIFTYSKKIGSQINNIIIKKCIAWAIFVHHKQWVADTFSSLFRFDVAISSQKDHKLLSATNILCSKKFYNKKIEESPLDVFFELEKILLSNRFDSKLQGLILPMCYKQLLCEKIPIAQKAIDDSTVF
jgi:hypothetical protein